MTISSSSSPARRDDDDGGVFSGRTESARESITLPDLLKRGTKKEDRESAAYEYCLGDADEASHPGWGRPSSVDEDRRSKRIAGRIASPPASLAGDAHPPSTKTGDRGESNLQSWSIEDPMARAIGGGCASASTWKGSRWSSPLSAPASLWSSPLSAPALPRGRRTSRVCACSCV